MKITLKIEDAPEGFNANALARSMIGQAGYEMAELHSITISTDKSGATIGRTVGIARIRPAESESDPF